MPELAENPQSTMANQSNSINRGIRKSGRLYNIIYNRCPRCQEGQFFKSNNPFNFSEFDKMHDRCPVCGQRYEIETGFYYGAMYVSYGINVALFVFLWLVSALFFPAELSVWWTVAFITLPSLILVPVTYRISRLIWISLFVRYSGENVSK